MNACWNLLFQFCTEPIVYGPIKNTAFCRTPVITFAKEVGKASLRSAQFKAALAGNATMLIWMGKQLLGQRDKLDHEVTGKDGGPIQTITTEMSAKEAAELYRQSLEQD